ncbi:MAG: hypothetical protein IPL38_06600 [Rhodobacter sp.]|nr:hypothetical protein [Rhodobacter sp.]
MNQTLLALSLGFGGVILATHAALGQGAPQCGARNALVAQLAERYGEVRHSSGMAQNAVVEVFASAETGTWTIAVTTPDGRMCLVAAGQGFETDTAQTPAKGHKV